MTAPLAELDDVKDQLHKVKDSDEYSLSRALSTASSMIRGMCIPVEPLTVTDLIDGGQPTLVLSQYPVNSITSVTDYTSGVGQAIAQAGGLTGLTDGWLLADAAAGVLRRVGYYNWSAGYSNIQVVYTVGPATVPDEVVEAVIVLTEHIWQFRRNTYGPGIASQDGMGYNGPLTIPDQVYELLREWLKPPRAA